MAKKEEEQVGITKEQAKEVTALVKAAELRIKNMPGELVTKAAVRAVMARMCNDVYKLGRRTGYESVNQTGSKAWPRFNALLKLDSALDKIYEVPAKSANIRNVNVKSGLTKEALFNSGLFIQMHEVARTSFYAGFVSASSHKDLLARANALNLNKRSLDEALKLNEKKFISSIYGSQKSESLASRPDLTPPLKKGLKASVKRFASRVKNFFKGRGRA